MFSVLFPDGLFRSAETLGGLEMMLNFDCILKPHSVDDIIKRLNAMPDGTQRYATIEDRSLKLSVS